MKLSLFFLSCLFIFFSFSLPAQIEGAWFTTDDENINYHFIEIENNTAKCINFDKDDLSIFRSAVNNGELCFGADDCYFYFFKDANCIELKQSVSSNIEIGSNKYFKKILPTKSKLNTKEIRELINQPSVWELEMDGVKVPFVISNKNVKNDLLNTDVPEMLYSSFFQFGEFLFFELPGMDVSFFVPIKEFENDFFTFEQMSLDGKLVTINRSK